MDVVACLVDVVLGAGLFKSLREEGFPTNHSASDVGRRRDHVSQRGKVRAVIGQNGVDVVGDGLDQGAKEVTCDPHGGSLVQLNQGELGPPVYG